MIKRSVHQEDETSLNVSTSSNKGSKYIKQKCLEQEKQTIPQLWLEIKNDFLFFRVTVFCYKTVKYISQLLVKTVFPSLKQEVESKH